MTTQIISELNSDLFYNIKITVTHGNFTIEDWVATLDSEEQQEWQKQHRIHDTVVRAAVAAGDARVQDHDSKNATIEWQNKEVHMRWINTIGAQDNASYHSFWSRYQAAMAERNT